MSEPSLAEDDQASSIARVRVVPGSGTSVKGRLPFHRPGTLYPEKSGVKTPSVAVTGVSAMSVLPGPSRRSDSTRPCSKRGVSSRPRAVAMPGVVPQRFRERQPSFRIRAAAAVVLRQTSITRRRPVGRP